MPCAAEECREPSGKCQGIIGEFYIVWRVVTLDTHFTIPRRVEGCVDLVGWLPTDNAVQFASTVQCAAWQDSLYTSVV